MSDVLEQLDVSKDEGLTEEEVERRRERFGPNELHEVEQRRWLEVLISQFTSVIVLLLAVAAVAAFVMGDVIEGTAVLAVLVINGAIGFVTEMRAIRSMESLQEMTEVETRVRRAGDDQEIPAEDLVPGDIVILDAGDIVPADLRVVDPSRLQVDESALTGESVPVGKTSDPLDEDVPLAERENMLYKGTYLTRGTAEAVVVATGPGTELGQISASLQETGEKKNATPGEARRAGTEARSITPRGGGYRPRVRMAQGTGSLPDDRNGHRAGGCNSAGRAPHCCHTRVGERDVADGRSQRTHQQPRLRRDARLHDRHLH